MTKGANPTAEAIIIDDVEEYPSLDHATLFKNLKDMLENGIKPAMEAQFTALQKMFAYVIEETISRKMTTLSNITAEAMNRTIDQIREDNTRL